MDWIACFSLLLFFVGFAAHDAHTDRSPRAPAYDWWRRKPSLVWWAERKSSQERHRSHINFRGK